MCLSGTLKLMFVCVDMMDTSGEGKLDFDSFAKGIQENKELLAAPHPGESVRLVL